MIFIAVGGNLALPEQPSLLAGLEVALQRLSRDICPVIRQSSWYRTAPVPPSGQPDFLNCVLSVRTGLGPEDLLEALHRLEESCGRERGERNAARTLDLDLLAYHDQVRGEPASPPLLPHPRMLERAFVLAPLAEIAPDWRHPQSGRNALQHLQALQPLRGVERLA